MKTTFYNLSEATRKTWGYDPYGADYKNDIVFEDEMEGSVGHNATGDILYFKLLSKKYTNSLGLDDWDIEITNLDEFQEIKEEL